MTREPIVISYEFIQKAAQQPGVRDAVKAVADRIADRASALSRSEGARMNVSVRSGTRPGGRPFSNVEGDDPEQEWGSTRQRKLRILGRAADDAK